MILFSLIIVLLLEQLWPLPVERVVLAPLRGLAAALAQRFNDGQEGHGTLAWALLAGGGTVSCALIDHWLPGLLGGVFMVVALYFTLGFRHEGHFFTDIHLALRMNDLARARVLLGEWRGGQYENADADELARLTVEQAVVAAHRNVFGVVFWFALLAPFFGPAGAVMYRLARFLYDEWGRRGDEGFDRFGAWARQAFLFIDWLPARVTAILYALVGNFEDALLCWRTQAVLWADRTAAVLVASGAGALGVRLGGGPAAGEAATAESPEVGVGDRAGVDSMQGAVGLIWRALVVYLVVLALAGIAAWVGD
ncbi:MAG: CobD/CbiB family protein [Azoarcus sp.]|jgi:adenosylcobinamide-phosphate synthase|nr:CobD/CbiB family protein [Azoarcus sp.]